MKIAINLTDYYRGSVGGIRVYLVSLIKDLPKIAPKDIFFVICRPEAAKELGFPGIHIIEVDHSFQEKKLSNRLLEIIKENSIDLWYSPLLVLDPLNCPIPSIFSIPDMQHESFPQYFEERVLRWRRLQMARSARAADHIITISEFSKKDIVKYLDVDPSKVSVTYLSTPYWHDEKYNQKLNDETISKYELKPHQYFFFPTNTWPHKNLSSLLLAFSKIKDKYPSINIVLVVQSANIDPKLQKIIKDNNLKGRIKFTGFVEDKYMQYIFRNALAVVSPSLFEGFGIPPLEAMKNGVPAICSNVTSHPEICGDAALYFDPLSINELSNCLQRIIEEPKLRQELIKKAQKEPRILIIKKPPNKLTRYSKMFTTNFTIQQESRNTPKSP